MAWLFLFQLKKKKQGCKYTVHFKDMCKELDPDLVPLRQKICCMCAAFTDSGHISWLREWICCGVSVFHRKWGMCPNFHCNHGLQIFGCSQKYKGVCGVFVYLLVYIRRVIFLLFPGSLFPDLRYACLWEHFSCFQDWNVKLDQVRTDDLEFEIQWLH